MRGDSDSGCLTLLLVLAIAGGAGWWEWSRYEADEKAKADAQAEARLAETREWRRKESLRACLDEAESNYWRFVRMNGGKDVPKEPGVVTAPTGTWNQARDGKNTAIAECQARYGSKTQ